MLDAIQRNRELATFDTVAAIKYSVLLITTGCALGSNSSLNNISFRLLSTLSRPELGAAAANKDDLVFRMVEEGAP